jgi:GWxTD domain-containing protein
MTTTHGRRGLLTLLLAGLLVGGCTSWQRVGDPRAPGGEESLLQLFNPGALYRSLGRMVGQGSVPFVATVAFVPGPGDSTRALIGVSLANRAFSFTREGDLYRAGYRVEYVLGRAGAVPVTIRTEDVIRVPTLQEALRTDESVLLQQEVVVAPGSYDVTIRITDRETMAAGVAIDSVEVPAFTAGTHTAPILVYEVEGRGARADSLGIILNPRGSLAYGGDTQLINFEGVGYRGARTVPVQVRDERDSVIVRTDVRFTGAREVESQVLRIAPDSAPLGQLQVIVGDDADARSTSGVVSFSGDWVITNFDDLLSLLRYFGENNRLDRLRDAPPDARADLWREFYRTTDPNRQTPENERLDQYFARLALANTQFRDEGIAGWRTDRGEVFITLGPPDELFNATPTSQGRYLVWSYNDLRASFTFQDQTGFGRYRLLPESRSEFERVKGRVQVIAPDL